MKQRIGHVQLWLSIALLLVVGLADAAEVQLKKAVKNGDPLLVQLNADTGSGHRIYGLQTRVNEYGFETHAKASWSVEQLSAAVLYDYRKLLRIDPSELSIKRVDSDGEMLFVTLQQTVDGLPVHGTRVGYTIDRNGYLVALGADTYQRIDLTTVPNLSADWATDQAAALFDAERSDLMEKPRLVIYRTERDGEPVFVHAWKVLLRSTEPPRAELFFINAEDGTLIERFNHLRNGFPVPPPVIPTISGRISGRYWPEHYYDTDVYSTFATTGIKIKNSSNSTVKSGNSDSNGFYLISLGGLASGTYKAEYPLQNSYIRLMNGSDQRITSTYTFSYYGSSVTNNRNWGATDATNVRYHANLIHNYFKNTFGYTGMDYQMDGYVDQGSDTNGMADGEDIHFGSQNDKQWARSSDVIYHEYTHNTIYHIYGGWIGDDYYEQGWAMDEGFADYYACTLNNDSIQGESVGVSRNLSNSYSWDSSKGAHWNGKVIGGACWDVRSACGASVGDTLTFRALQVSPQADNFEDFLSNMIVADNNNYNGSHVNDILVAFANHDITLPLTASISGPSSISSPSSGTWTVTVSGGVPSYSYQWYYRPAVSKAGAAKENTPGPEVWLPLGTGVSITRTDTDDFELKCRVTDSWSTQVTSNIIYVNVS